MNVEIRIEPVGGNHLADDYRAAAPALTPFFPGSPSSLDAYRRKADEVRGRFDPAALEAMAEAIQPLGRDAADRARTIAAGDGFFVTTGQQPGLFGGPLYTVHKALTAIALARRLEAELEVPVLALFWVAADDHDWDEANHVHVLDPGNTLHRLALDGPADPPLSMGHRRLGTAPEAALDELEQVLPPSDFTPAVMERLRGAYSADATVAGAFEQTMAALFDGLPLALVNPQHPAVRRAAVPVLRRALTEAASDEAALAAATARLESAGYRAQVPILPGASNVFYEDEQGRERMLREGGGWRLRASGRRLEDDAVAGLLADHPERFSANVVLRPVLESAVFPTLAYVGGPGEVRYLAQTGCLFEAHGVGMPLVVPRLSVTLVEGKVRKVLDKFGLDVDAFSRPAHELVAAAVRDEVPDAVEAAVGRLRQALQEGYQGLFEAAREVDPTLKGPIFHARNDGFKALGEVEKKIRQHVKLRAETELEQIEKAAVNLAPDGRPQERVLNVHQYVARYGPGIVPAILERMSGQLELGADPPARAGAWGVAGCGNERA